MWVGNLKIGCLQLKNVFAIVITLLKKKGKIENE